MTFSARGTVGSAVRVVLKKFYFGICQEERKRPGVVMQS